MRANHFVNTENNCFYLNDKMWLSWAMFEHWFLIPTFFHSWLVWITTVDSIWYRRNVLKMPVLTAQDAGISYEFLLLRLLWMIFKTKTFIRYCFIIPSGVYIYIYSYLSCFIGLDILTHLYCSRRGQITAGNLLWLKVVILAHSIFC